MLLVDRMGRRMMYLIFGSLSCLSILIIGVLGCVPGTASVKTGIVALDVIFYLFYIMSFGPMYVIILFNPLSFTSAALQPSGNLAMNTKL